MCPLPEGPSKRERESLGVAALVRKAFGDQAVLQHDKNGAPSVVGSDWHISVSHSRTHVCLAVNPQIRIGVDIEDIGRRIMNVAHKILDEDGLRLMEERFAPESHCTILTTAWCIKESVFKAEGATAGYMGENVSINILDFKQNMFSLRSRCYTYNIYTSDIGDLMLVLAEQLSANTPQLGQLLVRGNRLLAMLIDPGKTPQDRLQELAEHCDGSLPDVILVGGSGQMNVDLDGYINRIRELFVATPVIIFPGSIQQFSTNADALMFLSVISGRNTDCLIGQQVKIARRVRLSGIHTLPMGYILIDGGRESSVEKATCTRALSQSDPGLIVDTAVAGELLGMKYLYLEAGSGALYPVSPEIIRKVRNHTEAFLIVGGGIHTVEQMQQAYDAGADMVVIGNHFEQHPEEIRNFVEKNI